jgi:hypothetical protein
MQKNKEFENMSDFFYLSIFKLPDEILKIKRLLRRFYFI